VPRVAVDGLSLLVHEWPGRDRRARPLVAIHGLTANHTCWAGVAEALTPAHRLIAYDLRGRGDSDKPATGYSLEQHCHDLEGLLDRYGAAGRRPVALLGHSLGAHIALRFAATRPRRVSRLVLVDGGFDVRAEILDALAPAIGRLGQEFPSREAFLDRMRDLPMLRGRWNAYLERYFHYDVEDLPSGAVRSKASRTAIEEELVNLARERLWVLHHRVRCPTLILRAPDGLGSVGASTAPSETSPRRGCAGKARARKRPRIETDCLMTAEEGRAMAAAIPRATLVTVPGTNHYTVLIGRNARVQAALRRFLAGG
jgi:pimeloyl-ACP methyl ester carboxylesterase